MSAPELSKALRRFIDARDHLNLLKKQATRRCEEACDADPFDGSPGQPPCWCRERDEPEVPEENMCGSCVTRQRARKAIKNARRREARAFVNLATAAYRGPRTGRGGATNE